jgi:hypothetical protein
MRPCFSKVMGPYYEKILSGESAFTTPAPVIYGDSPDHGTDVKNNP